MKKIATISSGLNSPRYITFINDRAYVTCWNEESNQFDDYVAVINLANNQVVKSIPVVEGPEHLVSYNNKLYVSHVGGWNQNNKVSIINTTTNLLEGAPIVVGDVPNDLEIKDGYLWIFCNGNPTYAPGGETLAKIVKMDLSTNVITTFKTLSSSSYSSDIIIYGNFIYYTFGNSVYKEILVQTNPATSIKSMNTNIDNLYALSVKNNYIYVGGYTSNGFGSNGIVKIFANGDIKETDGNGSLIYPFGKLMKTTAVGIGPNGFYFNQ